MLSILLTQPVSAPLQSGLAFSFLCCPHFHRSPYGDLSSKGEIRVYPVPLKRHGSFSCAPLGDFRVRPASYWSDCLTEVSIRPVVPSAVPPSLDKYSAKATR